MSDLRRSVWRSERTQSCVAVRGRGQANASRDLSRGSPSACLCSSLISWRVILKFAAPVNARPGKIECCKHGDGNRNGGKQAYQMAMRISSGNWFGSVMIASTKKWLSSKKIMKTMVLAAANLKVDFRNSTRPAEPNIRDQPLMIETRDASGWIRSKTIAGRVLQDRCEDAGARDDDQRPAAGPGQPQSPMIPNNCRASSALLSRQSSDLVEQLRKESRQVLLRWVQRRRP